MAKTHNLGFPRVGARRELKRGLESFWKGDCSVDELMAVARARRTEALRAQEGLDFAPVGDFSLYDHVLDTSFLLGHFPERARCEPLRGIDNYFRLARGRSSPKSGLPPLVAAEMTKWWDTNYHYLVPEISASTEFAPDATALVEQLQEALAERPGIKPILVGPCSYLWLSKSKDGTDKWSLLPKLIEAYAQILDELGRAGAPWVQLDEPCLVTDLDESRRDAVRACYDRLAYAGPRVLVATYFGQLRENLELCCSLPVHGLHIDAVSAPDEVARVAAYQSKNKVLSLGVISGRNVWKSDLGRILDACEPLHEKWGDRLFIAPSCSLLHVPVDLRLETKMDPSLKSWLAFAKQKLDEVRILARALNEGRSAVSSELEENAACIEQRQSSDRVHDAEVQRLVGEPPQHLLRRQSSYPQRAPLQKRALGLPSFPTTTIGSFPQTEEIRRVRAQFRTGGVHRELYETKMREEIRRCIQEQEALDLDVLVHGEAERNDMVEYFGERLRGYGFSEHGWVQSYGSRCVKPPILYGDVSRLQPMTLETTRFAQSCTNRPVKGMLTGPVTMLNWSFVRDDQPRQETCKQLAWALRQEVLDLQNAGVKIIQIDEAALREGLPLRQRDWPHYLEWAVNAFRLTTGGVADETQIHTHMCYSEFNDIIEAISKMDADVITIETSRSDMELLEAFRTFDFPSEMGPGVYDIHSPTIPTTAEIEQLLEKAAQRIAPARLWVNPDCGLKTRTWAEVTPALSHMVAAAHRLRERFASSTPSLRP